MCVCVVREVMRAVCFGWGASRGGEREETVRESTHRAGRAAGRNRHGTTVSLRIKPDRVETEVTPARELRMQIAAAFR